MRHLLLLGIILFLSGCNPPGDEGRLEALEARVAALESPPSVTAEKPKVSFSDLDPWVWERLWDSPLDDPAYLKIGGTGYSVAWTTHGPIALFFKDIRQLSSGARVTISAVNMSSVDWTDVALSIEYSNWVLREDGTFDGVSKVEEQETKTTSIKVAKAIPPQKEELLTLDLTDMKFDQVKGLKITVSVGGIQFIKAS